MPILLTLAVASVAVAVTEAPLVIDLLIPRPCAQADDGVISGEIVVCAEADRQSLHRLQSADRPDDASSPKAEFEIKEGVAVAVETESADLGMARAQRAMVRVKIKF